MAASNGTIQEALAPKAFTALSGSSAGRHERMELTTATASPALARHLDDLAHDIIATPGAGGALIAAYAAQARALTLVVEAAQRAGSAPLPASVVAAAQEALASHRPFKGLMAG